jgi:hypothetical protein
MAVEAAQEAFALEVAPAPVPPVLDRDGQVAGRAPSTRSEPAWVPVDACTLPTADRPTRLAEFDGLFAALLDVRREEPGWLRLRLDDRDDVEDRARDLVARESGCCSFFDFAVHRGDGAVVVDVRVPDSRIVVLEGLAAQAEASRAARM